MQQNGWLQLRDELWQVHKNDPQQCHQLDVLCIRVIGMRYSRWLISVASSEFIVLPFSVASSSADRIQRNIETVIQTVLQQSAQTEEFKENEALN